MTPNTENLRLVEVTDEHTAPAGDPGECFWCKQPVGGTHTLTCVTTRRSVRVRMTVELEIHVPQTWGRDMIEFHRNDSSWCANNVLEELQAQFGGDGDQCMCGHTHFEYIGEVNPAVGQETEQ